jgi:hypothetical protein
MRAMLWRVVYAIICFVIFWWILPLVLQVLGVPIGGPLLQLLRACTAAIAILYIIFGKEPPYPW